MEKGTYWLKSNIGIVLLGPRLLYRNHRPAENGAIGKSRLISAYVSQFWENQGRKGVKKSIKKKEEKEEKEEKERTYQTKL